MAVGRSSVDPYVSTVDNTLFELSRLNTCPFNAVLPLSNRSYTAPKRGATSRQFGRLSIWSKSVLNGHKRQKGQ
jgi:hypothetical protein